MIYVLQLAKLRSTCNTGCFFFVSIVVFLHSHRFIFLSEKLFFHKNSTYKSSILFHEFRSFNITILLAQQIVQIIRGISIVLYHLVEMFFHAFLLLEIFLIIRFSFDITKLYVLYIFIFYLDIDKFVNR